MATTKLDIRQYFMDASARAAVLGHSLYFSCDSHAFAGRVIDVETVGTHSYLVIEGAQWVFETGDFKNTTWANAEKLPNSVWRVAVSHIESWGDLTRKL